MVASNFMRRILKPHKVSMTRGMGVTSTEMPELSRFGESIESHEELHKFSVDNPDKFWSTLARNRLLWYKDFKTGMKCDMKQGKFSWFLDGQLNVSVNCVDRWAEKYPERVALVWEKDEPGQEERVTYSQLLEMVSKLANCLKNAGVKKGDVVALYLPLTPVAVAAMLATARIGAIHSVIYAGFSSEAIASRIKDAKASVVITADEAVRAGKKIPLKESVDTALTDCPEVKTVFVQKRTGADVRMVGSRDVCLEEAMAGAATECKPEVIEAEDPLFILYTSGSTGKPKVIRFLFYNQIKSFFSRV